MRRYNLVCIRSLNSATDSEHPMYCTTPLRWGALCGITFCLGLVGAITHALSGGRDLSLFITPIAASITVLFTAPNSAIARPWAIIGGSTVSGFVGVAVATIIREPMLACPLAVLGSLASMSAWRCHHPPGAAVALSAVLGNHTVHHAGYYFAIFPICLDSILIVCSHLALHRLSIGCVNKLRQYWRRG